MSLVSHLLKKCINNDKSLENEEKHGNMDMKNSKELMEQVINETLAGLSIYVRDQNLEPKFEEQYRKDTIIREKGFTDASSRNGGIITTHRLAILSNHMMDLSQLEEGTNWGLSVAKNDAHFKVLDISKIKDKTLITILHLPDNENWKLFENVKIDVEETIIEESRKCFEKHLKEAPIPELATDVWLERCSFPIGMDDNGRLWPLED
ncbi:MAG: hypothetical protein II838_10095 [Lachnospiraceae bacterium]|nr:hypothetical protein [Lachnospiraceae bacterium]